MKKLVPKIAREAHRASGNLTVETLSAFACFYSIIMREQHLSSRAEVVVTVSNPIQKYGSHSLLP
jgi:hypothetical protein